MPNRFATAPNTVAVMSAPSAAFVVCPPMLQAGMMAMYGMGAASLYQAAYQQAVAALENRRVARARARILFPAKGEKTIFATTRA